MLVISPSASMWMKTDSVMLSASVAFVPLAVASETSTAEPGPSEMMRKAPSVVAVVVALVEAEVADNLVRKWI